jgi:hypothetical protein
MRKFYYVVDIEVDDYGDDVLECTGSKLVTIYEIIDNEPKQLTLLGLSLEEDSEQVSQDYLIGTFKDETFELIRL